MTTSHSPIEALQKQADKIAKQLKLALNGEISVPDPAGKLAAALKRESISFAIVQDDKVTKIEMPWSVIRSSTEAEISAWILDRLRGVANAR